MNDEKLYTQAELNQAIAEARKDIKAMLEIEKSAAQENLKYQEEVTKNANLVREWKGTVFGIDLCLQQLSHTTKKGGEDGKD